MRKILFWIFLFYVVGDIATTVAGLNLGLQEYNPIFKDNMNIAYVLKFIVFGAIVIYNKFNIFNYKIINYLFLIGGVLITISNSFQIYRIL